MSARKTRKMKRRLNRKFASKLKRLGASPTEIKYAEQFRDRMNKFLLKHIKGKMFCAESTKECIVKFCENELEPINPQYINLEITI